MTESNSKATDLGAVFDAHVKAEFIDKDVAATMATMVPEPEFRKRAGTSTVTR
jgi:hypothetical protein